MKKAKLRSAASLLLAAAMAVSLAACGSSASNGSGSADTKQASTASGGSSAAVEATAQSTGEDPVIPDGESVSQDTDITCATYTDFTTMDPMDTSDTISGGVQRLIMDGLFGFDDDMKVIPLLATGYEANDSATEYTVTLRQGVSFTDGTPFNADAVIANANRWMDKNGGLKRTTFLSGVLASCDKVDDYTVKFTLSEPFGSFINCLAHPATLLMSPKQIEQGQKACADSPVGTGQYTFVEWTQGDHLKIQLNKDWWGYKDGPDGKPLVASDAGFKTVTFKPVTEGATRAAMIQSGDAQVMWSVPAENADALKSDPNIHYQQTDGLVTYWLMMNTQKAPFTDLKVRQAMNYAIDKDAFIKICYNGIGTPATSMMGPKTQYYKENTPYPYDVEKAKSLLKEAGYENGFTAKFMYSNTSTNQKVAEFLKQQLQQVGINLELEALESAVLNQKVQDSTAAGKDAEVELYYSGWSSSTGDADWALRPMLAKESEPPMSYNISYYENDEVDQLLKDALATSDSDKRKDCYAKIQDIVWEDCPVVPLFHMQNTIAVSNKIANVKLYPDAAINLRGGRMAK
ncbi:MAG: glutathione ABC transporter substrate-binding protein [Oribacterium sp.]|nr:glutathione ABC transporter substrate-binding protein [Oribacterium sp.]